MPTSFRVPGHLDRFPIKTHRHTGIVSVTIYKGGSLGAAGDPYPGQPTAYQPVNATLQHQNTSNPQANKSVKTDDSEGAADRKHH